MNKTIWAGYDLNELEKLVQKLLDEENDISLRVAYLHRQMEDDEEFVIVVVEPLVDNQSAYKMGLIMSNVHIKLIRDHDIHNVSILPCVPG